MIVILEKICRILEVEECLYPVGIKVLRILKPIKRELVETRAIIVILRGTLRYLSQ